MALWARCPAADSTPLHDLPWLAESLGVAEVHLKDESQRIGLGSFKALGAAYVIAREAAQLADNPDVLADPERIGTLLKETVYVCASAGNHGLSVAAGARVFGATAVIYLSTAVPEAFGARLEAMGARVIRAGADYAASMDAAATAAKDNGWTLLSDSSWPGYVEIPSRVMQGYLIMGVEVIDALSQPPTHIFLQAGVGGFAAAMAALFRSRWDDAPRIIVVEPHAARTLTESIRAGRPVTAPGPVSSMGRLDCKDPSHLALGELARSADVFVTITDDECARTVRLLADHEIRTTPSGAAGVSAAQQASVGDQALGLTPASRVLAFITEGTEDAS